MQLPQDYGFMMAPVLGGMFSSVDSCSTDGQVEIDIVDIIAGSVEGADEVEFKVAWPPADAELWAAGRLPLHRSYRDPVGATGPLRSCDDMSGPVFEIAVVLPPATTETVVLNDFVVDYRVGGEEYRARAEVRLGTCAADPDTGTPAEGCDQAR